MMRSIFVLVFVSVCLTSCEKKLPGLPYQKLNVPSALSIRDIIQTGNDTLFSCGGDGSSGIILNSTDGGLNWNVVPRVFDNSINAIHFTDQNTGYAADADLLIYKTFDGGLSWEPFYATSWPQSVNRNLRSIAFINDSTGFACGGKNFANGVLFRTTNGGGYWSFAEFDHEYRAIEFNNNGTGIMCGYGSLMRTADNGNTWHTILNGNYFTGLAVNATGNFWVCSLNGDVHASYDDGRSWHKKRDGSNLSPSSIQLNCIAISPSGRIAAAGTNGNFTFSDDGHNWHDRNGFDENTILQLTWINDAEIIAVGKKGSIYKAAL